MKRFICSFLILSAPFVGSCSKTEKILNFKTQVLHLNLASDPTSLDPRRARSLKDLTVIKHLFEGLMRSGEKGLPEPALAKEIKISDDKLSYTFILKESNWSNGDPVTAKDFEYAWKKVLDPQFATDYSHLLYPIKNAKAARKGECPIEEVGVCALDEHTLQVELETITPYFLELVAFPTFFPVCCNFENANPNWANNLGKADSETFVCNGPFLLCERKLGDRIVLKKNPLYWDAESVFLEGIDFSIIADNNTESHLFDKGKIDWLGQPISNNISTDLIGEFRKQDKLHSYPVAGTFWFKFNTEKEPFNNAKMRKAFSYAINRRDIITHILQGNQQPATSPVPGTMSTSDAPFFHDGDIPYANRLFEEALTELGLGRKDFPTVLLSYPITERNSKIVQLVQRQWEEAFCIPIKLNGMEGQNYNHEVKKGAFQIGVGDWIGDFNDPISFLELFKYKIDRTKGSGFNDTGFEDPEFIRLLDLSSKAVSPEERTALLAEAERILVEQMPVAPVYHYCFDYIKQKYVQNEILSPLGLADFKKARIGI